MNIYLKRGAQFLAIGFVAIQFIRPAKNIGIVQGPNHISSTYPMPHSVNLIVQKACNDCHSNNTFYPWYSNIQPIGWWLANHVNEGKQELNFSEFATYRIRKQYRKLEEIDTEVQDNKMPMKSYTITHGNAKLTSAEKVTLSTWANALRDSIKAHYPEDSLKKPTQPVRR
jgi:Haem-binding domain